MVYAILCYSMVTYIYSRNLATCVKVRNLSNFHYFLFINTIFISFHFISLIVLLRIMDPNDI